VQQLIERGLTLMISGWSGFEKQGGLPDEARLEQTPYPFQPH